MSQVLVGEIVFKLKADTDALIRNLRTAASQVDALDKQTKKMNGSLAASSKEMDKASVSASKASDANTKAAAAVRSSTKSVDDNKRAWSRLAQEVASFGGKVMKGLKIPAIVQALTLASAAVGALGAAFLSTAQALAPLSGMLVGIPFLMLAIKSSTAVVKAGFEGVSTAMKALATGDPAKISAAFSTMSSSAKQFTLILNDMKEALDFKGTAERGLMPGLVTGLVAAIPLVSLLRTQVFSLAQTLGDVGKKFGQMVGGQDATAKADGYNRFYRDIARLGAANTIIVGNLGRAFLGMVDALRSVMAAGAPLIIWLSNGIAKMGEWANKTVSAARASGALTRFFERTALVGKTLSNTFRDIVAGLGGISKAGGASMGMGFLESLEKMAAKFREFTTSADGTNKISRYFREIEPAIKQFSGLIGDVLGMFSRLASSKGLVTVISDIRNKLLPAIEAIAAGVTMRMGPALVEAATAFVNFANILSFTPLVLLVEAVAKLVNGISALVGVVPGLGLAIASFLALASAVKLASAVFGVFGTVMKGAGLAAQFAALSNGMSYLGAAARGAAAGMGALKIAMLTTGIGAAIVALGTLLALKSKWNAESKARVQTGFEGITARVRKANPDDAAYVRGLQVEVDMLKKVKQAAEAANKASDATTRGEGYSKITYKMKDAKAGALALRDAFKEMGVILTEDESVKMLAKLEGEAKVAMAEVTLEANRQADAYELLVGANVDLAKATAGAGENQAALVKSMTAAGKAAYDAVMATGDLVALYEKAGKGNADGVGASFKQLTDEMAKTVKQAQEFSQNISTALAKGFDPAAIAQLVAAGPATAGPMLAQLAAATDKTLIAQFNSFATQLAAQAVLVAEQARVMNQAINFEDDSLSKQLPLVNQALMQIYSQGITTFDGLRSSMKLSNADADVLATALGAFGITISGIPPVILDIADPLNKFDIMDGIVNTPRTMPIIANTNAAVRDVKFVHGLATARRTFTLDANTDPAIAALNELRRRASMPIRQLITVSTIQTFGGSPRSVDRANANGSITYFANGGMGGSRENHIAQIAKPGDWRVWAEPETGGEAYIPLAASKRRRSMEILRQTANKMGARVSAFANGSPVTAKPVWSGTYTPGSGLARSATTITKRGGDADDLNALIASYNKYLDILAQTARREELLATITKARLDLSRAKSAEERKSANEALSSARKALKEFDTTAARNKEIAAVEKMIDAIERETAALAAAAAKHKMIENNMYEAGDLSGKQFVAILDARIKAEEKYTDEWMGLVNQRQSIIDREVSAAQDAADKLAAIADSKTADANSALDTLNTLLDEAADLRASIADEESRHAQAVLDIQADFNATDLNLRARHASDVRALETRYYDDSAASLASYNSTIDSLLRARHETLTSWARVDEQAGPLTALPVEWINSNIREQIAQFAQWSELLASARSRGVSEDVITALGLDAGPQMLGQLHAFTAATTAEIDTLNALVLARSQQAGEQVAREAASTQGALGDALVSATREYISESTRLRSLFDGELAALNAQLAQDMADNLADMQARMAAESATFTTTLTALQTTLANLGLQTGRSLSDAIAEGMASGLPGIQAVVQQVISLAAQAATAALAATNGQAAADAVAISYNVPVTQTPYSPPAAPASAPTYTPPPPPSIPPMPSFTMREADMRAMLSFPQWAQDLLRSGQTVTGGDGRQFVMINGHAVVVGSQTYTEGMALRAWNAGQYDKGGVLSPGLTMAYNGTGQNEYILTGDQVANAIALAKSTGPGTNSGLGEAVVQIAVYLDGQLVSGVAKAEVVKGLSTLRTELLNGRNR